jgi:hypothetical protein
MKKAVILIALAALVPLAGCVAPYGYYDRGYYGGGYGPGYRGSDAYYGYNQGYEDRRYAPWADYNSYYDDGYDD